MYIGKLETVDNRVDVAIKTLKGDFTEKFQEFINEITTMSYVLI